MYDVIIIGAGVIGASIARELSRYKLKVLVLEKENDVGEGASSANSAIIHSGYDPKPGTLKAKLNVEGNKMFDEICRDLDIEFRRIGSITLACNDEEVEILKHLVERSKTNGVDVELLNHDELKEIEPNITNDVKMGLLAKSAGIINPFEYVVANMENAIDNGVTLHLSEKVIGITRESNCYKVKTVNATYDTKYVINASGVYSDKVNEMVNPQSFVIRPRRGEYYVLDHFDNNYIKHVLFNVPTKKGKGVLVSPTTHYNYLVGPSSEFVDAPDDVSTDKETLDVVKIQATRLVDKIRYDQQIRVFAGNRAVGDRGDFIIEETSPFFINVAAIESPGFASSPAIAKMVSSMIKDKELNPSFNPKRRPLIRLNEKPFEVRQALIKENDKLGKIVCRCEKVSEGEIVDVINRSCGATTVKGVKKRVRPGFGKCQGGFCESLVLKILSRELKTKIEDIPYGKVNSYILEGKTKGEGND